MAHQFQRGQKKGRNYNRTIQITIALAYQLVHTNWRLSHLVQQLIETSGRVPFCAHCTSHAGSILGDKLGKLSHPQTPSNSREPLPFHRQHERSIPDGYYLAKADQDL